MLPTLLQDTRMLGGRGSFLEAAVLELGSATQAAVGCAMFKAVFVSVSCASVSPSVKGKGY